MYKSYELTKKLEVSLGPDTAELSMRFGLHSGPVIVRALFIGTSAIILGLLHFWIGCGLSKLMLCPLVFFLNGQKAGVLRGERSRFQLFGDTGKDK